MNKIVKVVGALTASFAIVLSGIAPASANVQESTVVIIDSAFDTSQIDGNVELELCISSMISGCNNGESFDSGEGAAGSEYSPSRRYASDWNHGTLMANSVLEENPEANLILIRNAKLYSTGRIWYGGSASLEAALAWVDDNNEEYNISTVLMSRGSNTYFKKGNRSLSRDLGRILFFNRYIDRLEARGADRYARFIDRFTRLVDMYQGRMAKLPSIECDVREGIASSVDSLNGQGVNSVFATGNDGVHRYVDSPACLDSVVAVTAATEDGKILPTANVAPNTDFAVVADNTSVAAARFAGMLSAGAEIDTSITSNRFGVSVASTN